LRNRGFIHSFLSFLSYISSNPAAYDERYSQGVQREAAEFLLKIVKSSGWREKPMEEIYAN
jgi:hypothetical protein